MDLTLFRTAFNPRDGRYRYDVSKLGKPQKVFKKDKVNFGGLLE